MSNTKSEFQEIKFLAEKVHAHYWPLDTPKWTDHINKQIDKNLNQNKEQKQVLIKNNSVSIDKCKFITIKKVGLTIPLFKKQFTLVFEGQFETFYAHVHITMQEENYLETFNNLIHWRSKYFSDSIIV